MIKMNKCLNNRKHSVVGTVDFNSEVFSSEGARAFLARVANNSFATQLRVVFRVHAVLYFVVSGEAYKAIFTQSPSMS